MRLLITGAGGFLGQRVVHRALDAGHTVRAMVRPGGRDRLNAPASDALGVVEADLCEPQSLREAVRDVGAVLHLAATMRGTLAEARAATVDGTAHLLEAMRAAGVARMVLVSSIVVYDYRGLARGAVLDEVTPLEPRPERRDTYCRVKIEQEAVARTAVAGHGLRLTVLRPGPIIGPGRLWTYRLGQSLGSKLTVAMGDDATLPLTYVDHCADAVVAAAERDDAVGQTLNVVDDDLPTQRQYLKMLREHGALHRTVLPMPRAVFGAAGAVAGMVHAALGGRGPVPGSLLPEQLAARIKPLRYRNERLKRTLGWSPRLSIEAAVAESMEQTKQA